MTYSCCFSLGWNLDIPEFLQKKFYNTNYMTLYLYFRIFSTVERLDNGSIKIADD